MIDLKTPKSTEGDLSECKFVNFYILTTERTENYAEKTDVKSFVPLCLCVSIYIPLAGFSLTKPRLPLPMHLPHRLFRSLGYLQNEW